MANKITRAVIPVAGLSTGHTPLNKAVPRELLPLYHKDYGPVSIIGITALEAHHSGIDDILLITRAGDDKRLIESYFDDNFLLNELLLQRAPDAHATLKSLDDVLDKVKVHAIRQGELRGLGHAILKAEKHMRGEYFAVMLPKDVICHPTPAIYQVMQIFNKYGETSTVALGQPEVGNSPYSWAKSLERTTDSDNTTYHIAELSKTQCDADLAVAGRYVLEPEIFDILEEIDKAQGKQGQIPTTDALNKLPHLYGVEVQGKWHDTTKFSDYHENLDYTQHHPIEFVNCA